MLTAAILVGLLTGYYFGYKSGAVAAVAFFLLGAYALVRPSQALYIYGFMAASVFAVSFLGPRINKDKLDVLALVASVFKTARKTYKKIRKVV